MTRIVVGVDGSPTGQRALRWALEEGELRGLDVEAVHAWHEPYVEMGEMLVGYDDSSPFEEGGREVLEEALAEAGADRAPVTLRRTLVHGPATAVLLAASADAELLVLGSRGHGGFTGLLLGSVSQHITSHARCSVVVIPPGSADDPAPGPGPDAGPVVVGVDGSDASVVALQWALEEARARRTSVRAVMAWSVLGHPSLDDPASAEAVLPDERMRDALRDIVGRHAVDGTEVEQVVVRDLAAKALLEASEGCQLVVVGTHGRSGLRELVLGSVTQQVVHHATQPVAVIRARADA